jgi:dTDP-4-dehydrorhamnose reductase
MKIKKSAIVIIGADSVIGLRVYEKIDKSKYQVIGTVLNSEPPFPFLHLDLSRNVESWEAPEGTSYALVCAANTSFENCRKNPAESRLVNVTNTVALIKKLVQRDVFVGFLSSNVVFDGSTPWRKVDDPVSPQSEYGRQKAEAENELLKLKNNVAIIRMTKVISNKIELFNRWIDNLKKHESISPFKDMYMAPIDLDYAVENILKIILNRSGGIFHLSGNKDISYEEAASFIIKKCKYNDKLIRATFMDESKMFFEHSPRYTSLDMSNTTSQINVKAQDVWLSIEKGLNL